MKTTDYLMIGIGGWLLYRYWKYGTFFTLPSGYSWSKLTPETRVSPVYVEDGQWSVYSYNQEEYSHASLFEQNLLNAGVNPGTVSTISTVRSYVSWLSPARWATALWG